MLQVLFTEARHSGRICTLFGDPDGGLSVPEYTEQVQVFAGSVPRIHEMLLGVERLMDRRRRERAKPWVDEQGRRHRGHATFTATPDDPMILVVLDEWPTIGKDPILGKACTRIAGQIGKRGRKIGVGLVVVTQIPSLEEMGSDAQAVRGMAAGMNIAAFRTAAAQDKETGLPMKLPIDPASLPERWPDGSPTAGLGFLARSDAAAAPMRGLYQSDPYHWATTGTPAEIPGWLLDSGGAYFRDWRDLLDVDDDEALGQVTGDAAAAKPAAVGRPAWDQIREVLADKPHGATTAVLAQVTGLTQSHVATTLRRHTAEAHPVGSEKCSVWKLGPAPKPALQLVQ
jgi:hypothetical protein